MRSLLLFHLHAVVLSQEVHRKLMTVHRKKGLSFKVDFFVSLKVRSCLSLKYKISVGKKVDHVKV